MSTPGQSEAAQRIEETVRHCEVLQMGCMPCSGVRSQATDRSWQAQSQHSDRSRALVGMGVDTSAIVQQTWRDLHLRILECTDAGATWNRKGSWPSAPTKARRDSRRQKSGLRAEDNDCRVRVDSDQQSRVRSASMGLRYSPWWLRASLAGAKGSKVVWRW